MATITVPPPRTPSPKVHIRSQSFDSPSSRLVITPIDEYPFSKSTGSISTLGSYDVEKNSAQGALRPNNVLLPLNTKMSDDSILSDTSSDSSSVASSPTDSESNAVLSTDLPSQSQSKRQERPHPMTFAPSMKYDGQAQPLGPLSPFLYQDTSCPMYSPWLVRVVLDMYDVHRLDWMLIAEPIERFWGVRTSSADVLGILSDNGRVNHRRWWD